LNVREVIQGVVVRLDGTDRVGIRICESDGSAGDESASGVGDDSADLACRLCECGARCQQDCDERNGKNTDPPRKVRLVLCFTRDFQFDLLQGMVLDSDRMAGALRWGKCLLCVGRHVEGQIGNYE